MNSNPATFRPILKALAMAAAVCAAPALLGAEENVVEVYPPRVLVLAEPQTSSPFMALAEESTGQLIRVFNRLGRFLPEEKNRVLRALSSMPGDSLKSRSGPEDAARLLKSDLLVVLSFSQTFRTHNADIKIRAINPAYRPLEKNIRVRSRIPLNIPLKLAREVSRLHEGLPVKAIVIESDEDGNALINAGEWNGLKKGVYHSEGKRLEIIQPGEYHSIIRANGLKAGDSVTIGAAPESGAVIRDIEGRIVKNTIMAYGLSSTLLKNQDDEGRFAIATCAINPGGSLCLGGYGSFLSTYYMGFRDPKPSLPGILISTGTYFMQLSLVPFLTGFKGNFFPWVDDGDKSAKMRRLHIFLWSTIPLTYTAAYFDQLAHQFQRTEHLPPFFMYRDNMALLLSAVFPGGGLFYKGYRVSGWAYFFSELGLAGYASYAWDEGNRGKYALAGAGAVKLVELISAYLMPSTYRFFNMELENDIRELSLILEMRQFDIHEPVYDIGVLRHF